MIIQHRIILFILLLLQMNVHAQLREGKKGRKSRNHTDSSSHYESDGDREAPKRKRGRPRTVKRDDVEGFTDSEVRRYDVEKLVYLNSKYGGLVEPFD